MNLVVRDATKGDMKSVHELIRELAAFEKEPDAVDISVADLEQAGFDRDPLFKCFVAEQDNMVVGMALVYFRFSTWKGKTLHLEDLVVNEQMRGKGVGLALYKRVMEYAKEENVKRVNWMVLDWNTDAIRFYERTGAHVHDDWRLVEMGSKELINFLKTN